MCSSLACVIHLFGLKCASVINIKQYVFFFLHSALRDGEIYPQDWLNPQTSHMSPKKMELTYARSQFTLKQFT